MAHRRIGRFLATGLLLGSSLIGSVIGQEAKPETVSGAEEIASPRLAALAQELRAGNRGALEAFWVEMKGHAPLVEPAPGEDRQRRLTFLWRGDEKTNRVALMGGLPYADFSKPLRRLPDSDRWFLTETHPIEARFEYHVRLNAPETLPWNRDAALKLLGQFPGHDDPLNPRSAEGPSYVELPGAPPQPWIVRQPNVPRGTLTEQKFKSEIMGAEYPLTLYTPPGYDPKGRRCWLMIAFDGGFPMMEVTLENLLVAGKIPPLVVVGVGNLSGQTRYRDLGGSEPFARFLVKEVVPWARKRYRVHTHAAHTIVGGISRGGLMAVYCGLQHADVFGKVLSQSGVHPRFARVPGRRRGSRGRSWCGRKKLPGCWHDSLRPAGAGRWSSTSRSVAMTQASGTARCMRTGGCGTC